MKLCWRKLADARHDPFAVAPVLVVRASVNGFGCREDVPEHDEPSAGARKMLLGDLLAQPFALTMHHRACVNVAVGIRARAFAVRSFALARADPRAEFSAGFFFVSHLKVMMWRGSADVLKGD